MGTEHQMQWGAASSDVIHPPRLAISQGTSATGKLSVKEVTGTSADLDTTL